MTNIIYNFFLQKYFSKDVDLENQSYKIALFKETYTPNLGRVETYSALSGAGLECEDENSLVSDNPNKGYKRGGIPISFKKEEPSSTLDAPEDNVPGKRYSRYSCDNITFKNITLKEGNKPSWAVVYREGDGLLVCCFPLQTGNIDGDDLELSWENTFVIEISANSIEIDTEISRDSINPVQNRVIAEALDRYSRSIEKYGIILNGEDPDDNDDTDEDNIDTLNRVSESTIDDIFGITNEDTDGEPTIDENNGD